MSSLIDSLLAAVADRPGDAALRVHLAELLLGSDRREEAIAQLAQVLVADPAHAGARALMSRAVGAAVEPDTRSPSRVGPEPVDGVGVDWSAMEAELGDTIPPRFVRAGDEPEPVIGDGDRIVDVEAPTVRLADVGGMREVKKRLEAAFLAPLRNPKLRALYRKSLRGGLLLYGPPGCGKTFLARAVAGEVDAKFISVSIVDVLEMWIGRSERNLHDIFEAARRSAPCVLFLDEVDALGHKRGQLSSSAMRTLGNQLLAELDGVDAVNEGVFVLAATNAPWDVDTALRRPGRLDRMLLVAPPDQEARAAILEYHLRDRPIARVDLARLAAATEQFSGADLAHVCDTAAEKAIESAITTGEVRMIEQRDLEAAVREVRPSTAAWLAAAKNVVQFGNQDGSYDDLARYLKRRRLSS